MVVYEKVIADEDFAVYKGRNFEERWYKTVIESSSDGYFMDFGVKKIL